MARGPQRLVQPRLHAAYLRQVAPIDRRTTLLHRARDQIAGLVMPATTESGQAAQMQRLRPVGLHGKHVAGHPLGCVDPPGVEILLGDGENLGGGDGDGHGSAPRAEGRQAFFFEKKNQKTFIRSGGCQSRTRGLNG